MQATPRATAPVAEDRPSAQYAYQQPATYGYDAPLERTNGGGSRFVIAGIMLFLVACCVLGWGLLALEVVLSSMGGPTPTPTPKGGMLPFMFPMIG